MRPSSCVLRWLLGICLGFTITPSWTRATAHTYLLLTEIAIGGDGGWDYLSIESASHRLYVTHGTKVVVIDTLTDRVVGEISDTPGVHGFALAPELGRGFASNGRENKASIVDLKTLQTIAKVETGQNPDAILYEPGRREVYTFDGRGQTATIFEGATGRIVATVPLGGKPEFAQADPSANRVYVSIEDRNEIIAIDAAAHRIVNRWPIAPGLAGTGLAIDLDHHRLFLGCRNGKVIVMDATNGRVVASYEGGEGIDAAAFDPGTQLVMDSAGGSGTVTIRHEDTPEDYSPVQTLATAPGARTLVLDPETHRIYLATARFEPAATSPAVTRARPVPIPGSFKVLVYGLK